MPLREAKDMRPRSAPLALDWRELKRLLVVRLDNIGDMVMLGPALRSLKQALPAAHLSLMASPAGAQVAPLLPWVDEVLVHRAVWQDASGAIPQDAARELALVKELSERHFDAALIFTSFSQSPWPAAYVCHLAGIPRRLGQSREFGGSLLSHWVKPLTDEVHQVDRNLHLLESTGLPLAGRHLELQLDATHEQTAAELLKEAGLDSDAPFIALAPGASCPARRYPPEAYAEAAALLQQDCGLPLLLLGSAREQALCRPILAAKLPGPLHSLVGRTNVAELAAIVARARLLLANDSGPMHIADAFRCPMVILFAGTEHESQWQPRAAPTRLLRRPTACSPCYGFDCPYNMECLAIPPREVATEALRLLALTEEPRKEPKHYATP